MFLCLFEETWFNLSASRRKHSRVILDVFLRLLKIKAWLHNQSQWWVIQPCIVMDLERLLVQAFASGRSPFPLISCPGSIQFTITITNQDDIANPVSQQLLWKIRIWLSASKCWILFIFRITLGDACHWYWRILLFRWPLTRCNESAGQGVDGRQVSTNNEVKACEYFLLMDG